jgi:hypothetical protein
VLDFHQLLNEGLIVFDSPTRNLYTGKPTAKGIELVHQLFKDSQYQSAPEADRMRVFLCHATGDKTAVRVLYQRLKKAGFKPWLDEEDLLPGQDWQSEIPKAVRAADAVLVCLSRAAVSKEGYVQKEIRLALDAADEKPEGTIFLIPVKLEECSVPERLSRWHWVHNTADGFEKLLRALRARAESQGLQGPR